MNTKNTRKVLFIGLFFLLFPFCLCAITISPIIVPGELKDINDTSKAWLSSDTYLIELYSRDTNVSKKITIPIKLLRHDKNIAILSQIDQKLSTNDENNNSKTFFIKFSDDKPYISENPKITDAVTNKNTIVYKNIKNRLDNDMIIFYKTSKITTSQIMIYSYISDNGSRKIYKPDTNNTNTIGISNNLDKIYVIKNLVNENCYILLGYKEIDTNTTTKYISKWIKVSNISQNDTQIQKILLGNIENGKKIFEQNCIACHRYNSNTAAPKNIAPILTNIGGWANEDYIKESLLNPNRFISPKYKGLIAKGKIMPMPSFDWLEEKELNDLIYFLKNLKAK